jgi:GT2 family glycosyltransferase
MVRDATAEDSARAFFTSGDDHAKTHVLRADKPDWGWLGCARFLIFARPGDILHPSLATTIARAAAAEEIDILMWNEVEACAPGAGSRRVVRIRRPELERLTLLSFNYIGLGFAARTALLRACSIRAFDAIVDTDGHLFLLWLLTRADCRWRTHPETLAVRVTGNDTSRAQSAAGHQHDYADLLHRLAPELERRAAPHTPRLYPRRRARRISVIIPYRDGAERTYRCVKSVARQRTEAEIELVLVDNQSGAATVAAITALLKEMPPQVTARLVAYDRPFNHSRQTNLGAAAASGDVLVFLSNDAELADPHVLDEAAAWTLVPGVATVGARLVDWEDRLVCAGVRVRRLGEGRGSASAIKQLRDAGFADILRETPINSFAFAAISRASFERVGPLDEVAFPVSHNDVEYCLRARRAGFTHLYLGHRTVRHVPMGTRARSDDSFQNMTLQLSFPELGRMGLLQLEVESEFSWYRRIIASLNRALQRRGARRRERSALSMTDRG